MPSIPRSPPPGRRTPIPSASHSPVGAAAGSGVDSSDPPLSPTHSAAPPTPPLVYGDSFTSVDSASASVPAAPASTANLPSASAPAVGKKAAKKKLASTITRVAMPGPPVFDDSPAGVLCHKLYNVLATIPDLLLPTPAAKTVTKENRNEAISNAGEAANLLISLFEEHRNCVHGMTQGPSDRAHPQPPQFQPQPSTTSNPENGTPAPSTDRDLSLVIENAVALAVQREIGKLQLGPMGGKRSYAQMAATPGVSRPGAPGAHGPPAPEDRHPPLPDHCLILSCGNTSSGSPREKALQALQSTIRFRETKYTAAKITKLSGDKTRVSFDTAAHRDDAMTRINGAAIPGVKAEAERKIRPLVILKGISTEVPRASLVETIMLQNPELNCFPLAVIAKFFRTNRNPKLYNAVLEIAPSAWKAFSALGRVRVEHQRVHMEEFSPLKHCRNCAEFGHTASRCSAPATCSHCWVSGHAAKDCPSAGKPPTCNSCVTYNAKFNIKGDSSHSPFSYGCPRRVHMQRRIAGKIDYGPV
jgi:hypothetical protein